MIKKIVFLYSPSRRRHIIPIIGCLLLTGLAPGFVFGDCAVPAETSEVTIPQWNTNSGWLPLTNDPALRSSITQLKVTVTDNNSTTGNTLHVLENWQSTPIISANVDATTTINIPAGSTSATLQFYIDHALGATYGAELSFCDEPPPPPPPACEAGSYSAFSVPQACLPAALSVSASATFGNWRQKIDAPAGDPTPLGTSNSGEDCRDVHDRYWVKGDDDLAYHTWHPSVADGCVFRHEHGDNAATSDIINYAEGYPAFGFAMEQQHAGSSMPRHEDHFGHKVFVANNIKLAIGTSTNSNEIIYDAGITCDWLSKIHQGSYSADALTNNTHEYYLNMQCDDTHQQESTAFSVKIMADWGQANKFTFIDNGHIDIEPVDTQVTSFLTYPWNGEPDPITPPTMVSPLNPNGGRGTTSISGLQWKNWNEVYRPAELWQQDEVSVQTVDLCYGSNGTRLPGGFCSILPVNYPGQDYWKSDASPFNGSVRTLNFKAIEVNNDGGPTEFCTDPFGQNASPMPCSGNQIRQKSASIRNYWNSQQGNPAHCITDTSGVCHSRNLAGTIERWTMDYQNGQWIANRVGAESLGGSAYKPALIGSEWISNHGNDAGVRTPN